MRILQVNLNHCRAAQELLQQTVRELDIDIALISEPYDNMNLPGWISDPTKTSAIWYTSGRVLRDTFSSRNGGFVRAKVEGITIYSCYIPPRFHLDEFKNIIDTLVRDAADKSPVLIAGDFNAWATEWGSPRTNDRGRIIMESFATLDAVLLNSGSEQTFNRNGRSSIIDITFASPNIAGRTNWHVSDIYTQSDHSAIIMEITSHTANPTTTSNRQELAGWKTNTFDRGMFQAQLEALELSGSPEDMARQLIIQITNACNASMEKRKYGVNKSSVYWWTEEIAQLRKECIRARRKYTRSRGRPDHEEHHQNFKIKKKALKQAIRRSKRECFLDVCDDVENNPFGLAYKLVTKKLKCLKSSSPTEAEILDEIVIHLFPQQATTPWNSERDPGGFIFPVVTHSEVQLSASEFKDRKAPGLDGIPNCVLKEVVKCCDSQILRLFNSCLELGSFPSIWKRQKLVLIPKDGKPPENPSSYRPLCMIDTFGKLLEKIICNRLQESVERVRGLSESQYGFRKGRSTIDAIRVVTELAKNAIEGKSWKKGSKEYCVVVTLDVKNAFNTANWERIVGALTHLNIPEYLVAIIKDYFRGRILTYDTNEGKKEYRVTGGVPQGSVLGPLLWNVMYDGILRLQLPGKVSIVGFADDIALVIVAKEIDEAKTVSEASIQVVRSWMNSVGLDLAEHKTEAVLITSRKVKEYISLRIGDCVIETKDCLKYLGVMIDSRLTFKQHFEYVAEKAGRTCAALSRIMPNTRGPKYLKRKILAGVVKSVILYAAPIWAESTKFSSYTAKISSVYRLAALRVSCAYRTVSDEAALIIAGMIPIDILAREMEHTSVARDGSDREATNAARQASIASWQARWTSATKGRWTYTLIPNVEDWYSRKHGNLNYYLTQFLSGHGCFRSYLHRFGHDDSPLCPQCTDSVEDPLHVFFSCPRFERERGNLEQFVENRIYPENVVDIMMSAPEKWEFVCEFVKLVILKLRREEESRRSDRLT